ncbi:hypothetical protein FHX42_001800 [Saccharopolyspora lacisalsi]|uniref:Uncharacterized protein n=1 Tax=Halosaccharopolyspora lacisalsi TaxID=1000566 RepID=A0A839DTT8_9PSEU|nr:hypothetical protein [Halosaccharopolyspora lacisalsi]
METETVHLGVYEPATPDAWYALHRDQGARPFAAMRTAG